ncbi:MAG: arsenosugar biosynthesis radical SAM protein ArsS [Actinobacteria bacterium]|nr:arsenosugar biosynthesis radical SAM protein ArsS [Actinomycetota bacterium]
MNRIDSELIPSELDRISLETLQLNLGRVCNLSCWHCHHESGPERREAMSRETAVRIAGALDELPVKRLELTGGSPELNPNFEHLVRSAKELGVSVAVRTNLVVIFEPGCDFLPGFYRENSVEIIGSLPCYIEANVDAQRGRGTFKHSIEALEVLNRMGYGVPGSGLVLNLVYNPGGDALPGDQGALELEYRKHLGAYGVRFDSLYALANMPIGRFKRLLLSRDRYEGYLSMLKSSCNSRNWKSVMCRRMATVDWSGSVYDCDFNLALGLDVPGGPVKIWDIEAGDLAGRPIALGEHCHGCSAGKGSGCLGALA